ncbi:MAG: SDR family oxidoreductase [bacterium]|nr:SDR family oxidoreductase [bacterium]
MSHPLFDLTGRVALVTGAGGGMGKAMALGFAHAGADLVLADLNPEGMQDTAVRIEALGRRTVSVQGDVSDIAHIRAMFAKVDETFGHIDVLANVAGEGLIHPPEDISLEQLQGVLQRLVVSRFVACQEAGRRMLKVGKGSIINIGSIAGVSALGRGHTGYSMAMGAVVQMTRELSTEWSGRGVRVNAILPAQVMNPNLRERIAAEPRMVDTWLRGIPTGRMGKPEDIVGPSVFLASDASAWITGILLPMDGGTLAMNAGGSYPGGPAVSG